MYKFFIKEMNNEKGFTITELLVVITVMSILVAVAVPVYFLSAKKWKINDCKMQCAMVTETVQSIMSGIEDNGKKQQYISVLCTFVEGRHKVYETTDRIDKKGNVVKDENGDAIKDIVRDWNGNLMFHYENHSDTNSDGICDVCKATISTNKYLTSANHIDQTHLVYKDKDGKELTNLTEAGIEIAEGEVSAIDTYTAFIRLDMATIGDIRGGYRYAEIRNSYLKSFMDAQNNKLKALQDIEKKKVGPSYTQKQKDADIATIEAKYTAPDELKLENILSKVQNSSDKAINNLSYRCCDYDYNLGCNDGYYLKKCKLWIVPVYTLFANQEMPRCPFDEDGTNGYFYFIDATGTCHCTCPECNS